MISLTDSDIESLIIVKRREIEKEKSQLGLSPPLEESAVTALYENNKENAENPTNSKQVKFQTTDVLCQRNDSSKHQKGPALDEPNKEFDEHIPPGLERFIRRYIGLPVMLKAGEYSPNNPLVRGERTAGDALLGLGEYERRRNTLRKIRQQQYREYLDQQAKKKQEAKEQAERERREREQREREREERGRELLQERENYTPDRRRSLHQIQCTPSVHTPRDLRLQYVQPGTMSTSYCTNKVDTGIQVDGFSAPLSVAVQTDEAELFQISPQPRICKTQMTQAERELSPRSVHAWPTHTTHETHERRRSYGDFDERTCLLKKCNRDKLTSDLRHSYMPSIFDADAIRLRNMQAEKEATERRQYYQQELKNQILEQQRIKEERKNREKMLEQAEMRRLEEQLRMLRVAQDREVEKQQELTDAMNESTKEYYSKRSELQREIDMEQEKLLRVSSQPNNDIPKRITNTSQSDNIPSKLPFYYSNIYDTSNKIDTKPYTTNIPENSVFSANYDVDSYLRKNLNFKKDKVGKIFDRDDLESVVNEVRENNKAYCDYEGRENKEFDKKALESLIKEVKEKRTVDKDNKTVEKDKIMAKNASKDKAFIVIKEQDCPNEVIEKQPSKKVLEDIDTLPIPVLRHSLKVQNNASDKTNMSDAMRKVDDKWQIPAVQKNILKAVPNEDGRNVSILTQLGSIRRQLQLEQLRLDKLMSKDNE